jgi:hypothetical protein
MTQPIYLRLCTETANDLPMVVSERWWRKFLLSQAVAFKIPLDNAHPISTSIDSRGSSTHGIVHEEASRDNRPIQV